MVQQQQIVDDPEDDQDILREINQLDAEDAVNNPLIAEASELPAVETPPETPTEVPASPPVEARPELQKYLERDGAAAPTPAPPPAPDPTAPPQFDAAWYQQQAAAQAQENARLQAEAQRAQLEAQTREYENMLVNQGLNAESAASLAQRNRDQQQQIYQAQQGAQAQAQYYEGKMNAAMHYGEQHGVSPRDLMQYETPQAMEAAAKSQAQIKALEKQVTQLTQSKTPRQELDNNRTTVTSGLTDESLVDSAMNKPNSEWSDAERAAMRNIAGA